MSDIDERLRSDAARWRAAAVPAPPADLSFRRGADAAVAASGSDVPRGRQRVLRISLAAAVVLLVAITASIGLHRGGRLPPADTRVLQHTNWVAPGTDTTLSFDDRLRTITIADGCTTVHYRLAVPGRTLHIGKQTGEVGSCTGPAGPPAVSGDPATPANDALGAVTRGTVGWSVAHDELTLRRRGRTLVLFDGATLQDRCARTGLHADIAGRARDYAFGQRASTVPVRAPAAIVASATGNCRAAVEITITRNLQDLSPPRYGRWRLTAPARYVLRFALDLCVLDRNGRHPSCVHRPAVRIVVPVRR